MPESFGARLRRRREEQKIALATIAEQTKINVSLLQALERDDVSHWPSGIFRRAFIRAYAHAIGGDPDAIVREFVEVYPEPAEVAANPFVNAADGESARTDGRPATRLRFLVGSAIGSLSRLRHGSVDESAIPSARSEPPASEPKASEPAPSGPDLLAVAQLCTKLGLVTNATDVQPLLREAVTLLRAKGLIVWVWDRSAAVLRPALAHGYSQRVLALLATVSPDANNATAVAFRSSEPCAVEGDERTGGALAIPLLTPAGCAGVLAIELQSGNEQMPSARAVATILAALLAQLIGGQSPADVASPAASAGDVLARSL